MGIHCITPWKCFCSMGDNSPPPHPSHLHKLHKGRGRVFFISAFPRLRPVPGANRCPIIIWMKWYLICWLSLTADFVLVLQWLWGAIQHFLHPQGPQCISFQCWFYWEVFRENREKFTLQSKQHLMPQFPMKQVLPVSFSFLLQTLDSFSSKQSFSLNLFPQVWGRYPWVMLFDGSKMILDHLAK